MDARALREALHDPGRPLVFVSTPAGPALGDGGTVTLGPASPPGSFGLAAYVPALTPDRLGDATFRADHGLRFAYVTGAMANGIGSVAIVTAMSRAGMLGYFGAAGLSLSRIDSAIDELQRILSEPRPLWGGT
ncbi:MAG TPA: 2-nitropropane dioxygenase, partial [Gemmataceae bacterium]|nr:2-nitropropane dioxygenase [Gemmataceae bacterium]